MPLLTLRYKDKVPQEYPIQIGQTLTIGRKSANDIVIDGNYVYIADRTYGLRVIDVSNPINPNSSETCKYQLSGINPR